MNSMPSMKKKLTALHSCSVAARSTDALLAAQNAVLASSKAHRRNFILGAGSVLDLSGSGLRIPELESLRDDAAKIKNDFSKIGSDFRDVLGRAHRLG